MPMTGQYTIEEDVGGCKVVSTMLNPLEIYRMAPRLVKVFLPILQVKEALARVASKLGDGQKIDNMKLFMMLDVAQFLPVLSQVVEGLGHPDNAKLPQELMCRTILKVRDEEGKMTAKQLTSADDINDAFRGKFMMMLRVMWFAASFNFADFFSGGQQTDQTSESQESTNR